MTDVRGHMVLGSFLHAPTPERIKELENVAVEIGADGRIAAIHAADSDVVGAAEADGRLQRMPADCWLIPGLVDCHVHAPQYPQLGLALDEPLERWLQRYTFPLESRYADLTFARTAYSALIDDLLGGGTTTALYFATAHVPATQLLADLCLERGQRALIGKVAMDGPDCPDFYRDADEEAAVSGTRAVIDYIRAHPANGEALVHPVVTPRFIPACTDAALEGLGALAKETGCHVQTHASESDWAHGHVLDRHGCSDSESLDRFGLIGRRTILAHANFVSDDDLALLSTRGAGIAHCPLSNAYFADAVFPLRRAMERGVHVGLGTDISGGHSASMFDAARLSLMAARMLDSGVDPALPPEQRGKRGSRIDLAAAFHLATAGGGIALDLPIGRFEPGCHFDALAIDCAAPTGGIRLFGTRDPQEVAAKILLGATRANIARVWVGGRAVSGERGEAGR